MAPRAQGRAAQRAQGTPAPRPERKPRELTVVEAPAAARRSISDVGTLLALGMFAVCLALAALHAVLVENQATLDDLIEHNQLSRERIDQLQAEIAFLDSPEGLAEHARSVGLVPAAELVLLTPIGPGQLEPPVTDPFSLDSSDYGPPAAIDAAGSPGAARARGAFARGRAGRRADRPIRARPGPERPVSPANESGSGTAATRGAYWCSRSLTARGKSSG